LKPVRLPAAAVGSDDGMTEVRIPEGRADVKFAMALTRGPGTETGVETVAAVETEVEERRRQEDDTALVWTGAIALEMLEVATGAADVDGTLATAEVTTAEVAVELAATLVTGTLLLATEEAGAVVDAATVALPWLAETAPVNIAGPGTV